MDDDGWRLALAWLLAALRPRGPYPVLALHGEHGTTKSTATRVLRSLVDPNVAPLRSEPREPRDLIIAATNGWAIALDNVSALPVWLSDALCRLSTGGGFSTRELYTDAEETLFDAMRPVLINGIEEVATRGDLADRAVVVTLAPVAETDRMTEEEFGAAFEGARAGILGALLEVVSGGLRELPRTRLDRLPRMADFARWVTACEGTLGWEAGAFVRTYTDARRAATEATLEASAVATPVLAFVRAGGDWTGTAAELLAGLEAHVPEALRRDRMRWPHSARGLSGALRRLGPALRAVGVDVEHLPRRHGGARPHRVARVRGEDTTVTTVTTVPEPVSPGPAGDGRADGGEKPSPPPSPKNASNGAGGDDGDDGDGPIPTSHGWGEV